MVKFDNINEHLIYTKAKSRIEAYSLRDEAKEHLQEGKTVVVFFNHHYHLYLAPGYDPYQIRKEIDAFMKPTEDETKSKSESDKTEGKSENTPPRDSSGKFVSKK